MRFLTAVCRSRLRLQATLPISISALILFSIAAPPRLVGAAAPQRLLWIADNGAYRHVTCVQPGMGLHITLFSCGAPELSAQDAGIIVRAFDHHIYPIDVRDFGSPGESSRINVVLAPFTGMTFGYFDQNDLVPGSTAAGLHSNHGNFLYVRSLASMPDADKMGDVQEVLAHELQHLIDFRVRVMGHGLPAQETWLNEGLSFFAQLSNGYWTPRDSLRVEASAADPAWSLTSMTETPQFLTQHGRVAYGRAGMFVTYLAAQYGARFTRALVRNHQTGMKGIDAVLRHERHGSSGDAFARWGVAQLLNTSGPYGYHGLLGDHSIVPRLAYPTVTSYPFDSNVVERPVMTLQPWTQRYVRFASRLQAPVSIRITAPATVRVAAVYGATTSPLTTTVSTVKFDRLHSAVIRLNGTGQHYHTVTLVISAIGSLRAFPLDLRSSVVRIQATSVDARHYQRVSRLTSTAG